MKRAGAGVTAAAIGLMVAASVAVVQAQGPSETGTQFYLKYRGAFEKAKAWEDIAPYMSSRSRKEIESRPPVLRPKMFALIKKLGEVQNPKVVKEEKTAEGALLTVEGIEPTAGKKATGTIKLVREGGAWKLDEESWSS